MRTLLSLRFSVFSTTAVLCAMLLSGCANSPQNNNGAGVSNDQASSNATASIQVLGPNGETAEFKQDLGNGMVLENVSAQQRAKQAAVNGSTDEDSAPGLITFSPLNATYEEYTRSRYDMVKGQQAFAIFFFSADCQECVALDKAITDDLPNFPEGSYVLKSDFNKDAAIRGDYNVSAPGAIVVVDSEGNTTYTAGSPLLDDLKAALTQALGV